MTLFNPPARHFPYTRMRRNRQAPWVRDMVQENHVSVKDLIWPIFIVDGENERQPIASMPGVERYSIDVAIKEVGIAAELGIPLIALFPITSADKKDNDGSEAVNPDNVACRAIRALKEAYPHIGIMCDVALDPYTSHGHDGVLIDGKIDNDASLEMLVQQALVQAQAGVDIISPSDMMDGRIGEIREVLEENSFTDTMIMSYAAKYASAFYGPFRDAVQSAGFLKGDKKTYQMSPANGDEALHEVALDIAEGADMVMVKPGLPYLDIAYRVKQQFQMPTFAYHISGEYAMLKAAAANGWLNYEAGIMEVMMAFKRAGCDGVLTYAARDIARLLKA
ncbi:MAG TPA: porphobilinogen synthase [Alphaproteobacteria bacterium]